MNDQHIHLCDYAVAFIDILGQKAEMPSRHLPADQDEAIAMVKKSVGKIVGTQKLFERFYTVFSSKEGLYSQLPEDVKEKVPDMAPGELKRQVFSDGIVIYVPLGNGVVKSPANSLFGLLMASGMLCGSGLAAGGPLRVGIDAAWAIEYRPGEIYGSAVAHAYQLESEVAQWPRVVVGEGILGYLQYYAESSGEEMSMQYRRKIARLCQGLISQDIDGQHIVDYLGNGFREAAPDGFGVEALTSARAFIDGQLQHWENEHDVKLAQRYKNVQQYYESHGVAAITGRGLKGPPISRPVSSE